MQYEDVYNLDVPESVQRAVWDFLENGRPALHTFKHEGSYTDRVMLALNEILGGQGVGQIEVDGEVMAQYVKGFEPTVLYDEGTGDYWVMRADAWQPV